LDAAQPVLLNELLLAEAKETLVLRKGKRNN
jgi:hypothetical protein